jgi:hypothetical protein
MTSIDDNAFAHPEVFARPYLRWMGKPQVPDEFAEMARLQKLLWPIIGHELPREVFQRLDAPWDLVGPPETWSPERERRMGFATHVFDGLEAAFYHRDRIESIERALVKTLRAEYSGGPNGQSASARTPTISHEWVAYLNASRRTLEYLARAVAECFARNTDKIKRLASTVSGAEPQDLSTSVAAACGDVIDRFSHLVGSTKGESVRDQAAHRRPMEPAFLFVLFYDGQVGIELHDGNAGQLEPFHTLDMARLTLDHPRLTQVLDAQLDDLVAFCVELLTLAIQAESRRPKAHGVEPASPDSG